MGVVTRVISMGSLMVFGFIKGFQPIAGFSYGAKKYDRLHEAIKTSILWSTIFCFIFGAAAALFSSSIISGFTAGDIEMIQAGQTALPGKRIFFPALWFLYCILIPFSCPRKSKGRFYPWCMQARNLFCPCHLITACGLGHQRNPLCPAHC